MARPKKSWEALKRDGAKPCIWQKRKREFEAAQHPGHIWPEDIFRETIRRERATFPSRRVDGQTVCADENGQLENEHFATIKEFATRNSNTTEFPRVRRLANRFLSDLQTGATRGFYFDLSAVKNTLEWINTFGIPNSTYLDSDVFAIANYLAWKRKSGELRFCKSWAKLSINQGRVIPKGNRALAQ
jgi:hypothetical protein